ncbi:MAG: hypothetical protein WDN06_06310 [Asticcacaulis sp.]
MIASLAKTAKDTVHGDDGDDSLYGLGGDDTVSGDLGKRRHFRRRWQRYPGWRSGGRYHRWLDR